MVKIQRQTQKIFAGNAENEELAVFGSMKTGNPIYTDNIKELQSEAYSEGWSSAIVANEAPFLEEMNGIQYALSKQLAYIFQEGIPEYDSETTYYKGSWCKGLKNGIKTIFESITDDNIGNPLTDETHWKVVFPPSSEIKLNNPYALLESKYSEEPLYNLSWLLSDGTFRLKSAYSKVYEALEVEYDSGIPVGTTVTLASGKTYIKRGLSVKLASEAYTDYDFVLNKDNETFRLPLKNKLASGNAVHGTGKTLGYTDGTNTAAFVSQSNQVVVAYKGNYDTDIGTAAATSAGIVQSNKSLGITTDGSKSGIETDVTGLYLYFYVGETIEDANIINAAQIAEQLTNKAEINLSNITNSAKEMISNASMPGKNYIDLVLGASGATYTAPVSGYYTVEVTVTDTGWHSINIENLSNGMLNAFSIPTPGHSCQGFMPVSKNDIVKISYTANGGQGRFRFIYSNWGEK